MDAEFLQRLIGCASGLQAPSPRCGLKSFDRYYDCSKYFTNIRQYKSNSKCIFFEHYFFKRKTFKKKLRSCLRVDKLQVQCAQANCTANTLFYEWSAHLLQKICIIFSHSLFCLED